MYTTDQSVRAIGRVRVAFATLGGAWLAMVAGYVDAVFFRLAGTAVTHVTGNAALFSADAAASNFDQAAKLGAIVGAFVLGAVLSGVIVGSPSLRSGRRYGVVLVIEGLLLAGAAAAFAEGPTASACLASCAAGLQNAMASTYMGLIVRTTHLTGVATDIGFLIGCALRGRRFEAWRLGLLVLLAAGFIAGAVTGAIVSGEIGSRALWVVSGNVIVVGAAYFAWRVRRPARL
ncbi:MAG: DUF1275 domain-containing protein [Phycisphaerales bacterium]|nr:DUF1275 domain-containing protein [Phycisphaerales bacterium]MCB9835652.1 DUF1275 domain-containing protein [Phycisphaera sp.]